MLIQNLKELATNHTGKAPKIAVVGVPHHFTEKQTEALQSAVALSGIKVGLTALISDAIMHESHYQIALIT
jgi:molecular chaperone DnaK (HSP70)